MTVTVPLSPRQTQILHHLNRLLWMQSPTGISAALREDPVGLLDLKLQEDFGFDSIDVAELWCGIEDDFALDLADRDIQSVATVREALALVEARTGTGGTPSTMPSIHR